MLKTLMVAGSVLFAAGAVAQTQQNQGASNPAAQQQTQTPGSKQPNAQGEQPQSGRTMQEKDTGLMNQNGGAPGVSGSTGTQSGTTPNSAK